MWHISVGEIVLFFTSEITEKIPKKGNFFHFSRWFQELKKKHFHSLKYAEKMEKITFFLFYFVQKNTVNALIKKSALFSHTFDHWGGEYKKKILWPHCFSPHNKSALQFNSHTVCFEMLVHGRVSTFLPDAAGGSAVTYPHSFFISGK